MNSPFRVVVENGCLRPLDPVDLVEGQEIEVIIVDDQDIPAASPSQLAMFPPTDAD